jgi:tetratricopeptide (TPR) repeat protein
MILRLSEKISRGLLVCVASLVTLLLSFFSIRAALAVRATELGTAQGLQRATWLEPGNPRNWYLLGHYWQYNMEQPDSQRAIAAYQTALSLNPNSSEALLELGTVYEADGDLAEARKTFVRAKRTCPASANVSWTYGNFLLRQGEQQTAFAEIRSAVLADPRRTAEAFSRCYRADPDADFILDKVLPATQSGYVDVIGDLANDRQTELAMNVWKRLVALHPHLVMRDVYPIVNDLLVQQQYVQARHTWDEGTSFTDFAAPTSPEGSVIWDGGFESGLNGVNFAWQFTPMIDGVQTSFDTKEKNSGNRSLRITFDGRHNVSFDSACARAVVQPATSYVFSAWVQTKALTTNRGVGFRLRALDEADSEISEREREWPRRRAYSRARRGCAG